MKSKYGKVFSKVEKQQGSCYADPCYGDGVTTLWRMGYSWLCYRCALNFIKDFTKKMYSGDMCEFIDIMSAWFDKDMDVVLRKKEERLREVK